MDKCKSHLRRQKWLNAIKFLGKKFYLKILYHRRRRNDKRRSNARVRRVDKADERPRSATLFGKIKRKASKAWRMGRKQNTE